MSVWPGSIKESSSATAANILAQFGGERSGRHLPAEFGGPCPILTGASRNCLAINDLKRHALADGLLPVVARFPPPMHWTPNKVTALRVLVGFAAVGLFGHGTSANLWAVGLTVLSIGLDALDGHLARKKQMATPLGAQIDILGDRLIENMFFTYFAVVGMVSLWLPVLFFARGAATDFLRGLALKAGHSGWGANAIVETWWGRALVASRWSRGLYAVLKCACFCYLGLELALTRGPVALLGTIASETHLTIRAVAQILTWATAAFCLLRGLPVLVEGWKFFAREAVTVRAQKAQVRAA